MITSKQPNLQTSIFAVMTALSHKHDALNLSQGFPDFDINRRMSELISAAIREGHNQYAPMPGIPQLREQIAIKTEKLYGARYDMETEVTVTSGATEALYAAITATVHPGDEVIVFEPWYDIYIPTVEYSAGKVVTVPLMPPRYGIDWDALKKAISPKTRAIILNNPHNPAGAVLGDSDIRQLIAITRNTNIVLIADEVYEHIVFDGQKHLSLARYPELAERSFVISSFGKTFHATGWKVGYCLAPVELTKELRKIHQFIVFSVHAPSQHAYAEMLKDENHYLELAHFYQQKRDRIAGQLQQSRFKVLPCAGTYFQLLSYAGISDENDRAFCERLTREHKIATIPTSVFYRNRDDHKVIRLCFAKKDETLDRAAEVLCRI